MTSERSIGGEMAIDPADLRNGHSEDVWPSFGKRYLVRCDTGRSALKMALLDWKGRFGGQNSCVWLPSYICPSVNAAIAQLDLTARSYPDRPGCASWPTPPTPGGNDIVIIAHYFGLVNRAAIEWLGQQSSRSWHVIEDCVQAAYTDRVGASGDYALTSLRKWWPAPDGALVCANFPISPELLPPKEAFVSQRLAAKLLRGRGGDEQTYLEWTEKSEELLESDLPREVSWASTCLLSSADLASAKVQRRANWLTLRNGLKQRNGIDALFEELAEGEIPLAFPVAVAADRRDSLRRFLINKRIYCPVHWALPPSAQPEDVALSGKILSIPIDQRYGLQDMKYVLSCIDDFFRRTKFEPRIRYCRSRRES